MRYIEREGVDRRGGAGQAYGPETDAVDLDVFRTRIQGDRHQFRLIVSPEDAEQLDDLRTFARHLLRSLRATLVQTCRYDLPVIYDRPLAPPSTEVNPNSSLA
nr:hypothetical protein [uncultured Cupriavidus sp.]